MLYEIVCYIAECPTLFGVVEVASGEGAGALARYVGIMQILVARFEIVYYFAVVNSAVGIRLSGCDENACWLLLRICVESHDRQSQDSRKENLFKHIELGFLLFIEFYFVDIRHPHGRVGELDFIVSLAKSGAERNLLRIVNMELVGNTINVGYDATIFVWLDE